MEPTHELPKQTYEVIDPASGSEFSYADSVFAWLCFLFGYAFCRATPVAEHPLGGFLFVCVLYLTSFVILCIKKVKCTPKFLLCSILSPVICTTLIFSESAFLGRLAFTYSIASYCYFLYCAFGNRLEPGISDLVVMEYIKAMFVLPFSSLTAVFRAVKNDRTAKGWSFILKILIGPAIAFIPTLMIFACLSYDAGFRDLLKKILDFDFDDVFSHLGSMLLAIPLGMYGYGLYHASRTHQKQEILTADGCRKLQRNIRIMPAVTAISATVPILFLYIVYFLSQWDYYMGAFTGILPESFSYAEYARSGFFQLCSVSVINLVLIVTLRTLMRRNQNNISHTLRILTCIFCVCTLILISTAVAKLWMYIDYYGLTPKRIYAMWLMTVIAIVYLVIAVGQFIPRAKLVAVSLSVCVALFAVLCLCNVNQVVARYNIDRYLDGTLTQVDMELMQELGDSAIPEVCRYIRITDDKKRPHTAVYNNMQNLLEYQARQMKTREQTLFSWNLPYAQARQALLEQGYLQEQA